MVTKPTLPASYQGVAPQLPSDSGIARPIIAKTDGKSLILKGVLFQNGKRYDIRIWRWDAEGNEINLDQNTQFSGPALAQIQNLAKEVFGHFRDPALSKIYYRDNPEMCHVETASKVQEVTSSHSGIVSGVRRIQELLIPHARMDWSSDPQSRLVIQPELLTDQEIAAMEKEEEEQEEGAPPKAPQANPAPTPTPLAPSAPPQNPPPTAPAPASQPKQLKTKREPDLRALNQASQSYQSQNSFLKDVTYEALRNYASQVSKSPADKLYKPYQAFLQVAKKPDSNDAEAEEMKRWLEHHYWHEFQARLSDKDFQNYFLNNGGKDFVSFCKRTAADAVVSYIPTQNIDLESIISYLVSAR